MERTKKNQKGWSEWHHTRINLYVVAMVIGGFSLARYWYYREVDHFQHHRHYQEPYSFFINRDSSIAAGWWPGRACQFMEFNCFSKAYDEAEHLLAAKRGEGHHEGGEGGGH